MLNEKEVIRIKEIISIVDCTAIEKIELIADKKEINLTIDGIQEDTYTNKNDFLNYIIEALETGANKQDKEFIKELEKMKDLDMKPIIDAYIKEFNILVKNDNMQHICDKAGLLLDLTTTLNISQQKEIYNNKEIKKHVGNITSLALMLLVDKEIKYTKEIGILLNIASLHFSEELNEEQHEILNGLFYKYDEYFKGDKDFYPTSKEIRDLLEI